MRTFSGSRLAIARAVGESLSWPESWSLPMQSVMDVGILTVYQPARPRMMMRPPSHIMYSAPAS